MKLFSWWKLTSGGFIADLALWLILLTPILVYPSIYQPFNLGRLLIFIGEMTLLTMGVLLSGRIKFSVGWYRSALFWWALAWIGAATVSGIGGAEWQRSWWGAVSRGDGLVFMYGVFVMITWLLLLVRDRSQWLRIWAGMSWIGSLSAVYVILQRFNIFLVLRIPTSERLGGLMGNPIFLGMLLLLTIFLTIYFLVSSSGVKRWWYLIGLLLQLAAILLTISRGPILGLIGGVGILAIGAVVWWRHTRVGWRWQWSGWLAGPVLLLAGVVAWQGPALLRLLQFDLQSDSIRSRLLAWSILWDAIKAKPLLGWGLENVQIAFSKFYRSGLADLGLHETIYDRAHNIALDQLVTVGWLGLFILLIIVILLTIKLVYGLKQSLRAGESRDYWLNLVLLSAGVAYLISLVTAFAVIETTIYSALLFTGVIFLQSKPLNRPHETDWPLLLPILIVTVAIFADLRYFGPAFISGRYIWLADNTHSAGRDDIAHQAYNQAQSYPNPYLGMLLIKFPSFARQYSFDLITQNKNQAAYGLAVDGLGVLDKIKPINSGNTSILMDGPLLSIILSSFEPGYKQTAYQRFDQLIADNPNREYLYLDWARVLTGIRDFSPAKAALDKVASLAHPPRELPFWRAVWGLESKQMKPAAIIADFRQATDNGVAGRLPAGNEKVLRNVVGYLVQAKRWSVASYYQQLLLTLPGATTDDHITMALLYKETGDLAAAANEAREVVKLDPSKADQTRQFLESIGQNP